MKSNPYIAGNPVGGSKAFIGRADVLRDVLRVLRSESENGMVLYGQRRIGKTSVLQELSARLPHDGSYAPVYFDLQDKAALPLEQVLKELANEILSSLDIPALDNPNDDFTTTFRNIFLRHVLAHLPEETSLVLLIDEFDVLDKPSQQQAGSAFFPYLRDLMNLDVKRIRFVFVIGRRPEDLSSVYLSLFKGIKTLQVSLLSPEDTAALIRLSQENGSLRWTDEVIAQVYQLTGGHPFLTQQLCQEIWESLYDDDPEDVPKVRNEGVEKAVSEALKHATSSLEWLWGGLGPAERVVMSALAQLGNKVISQEKLEKCLHESGVRILIGELQDAPKILERWDIIQLEDSGYRIRVEMLRQWVVRMKPLNRVRDEIDRILPVADSLFQAAYGFYQGRQLKEAEPLLQQAVGLNPNHLKANQLLAEIYLAKGDTDEALKILETLYEYNPSAAKPRLVQILLGKAREGKQDDMRLALYDKILKIDHTQSEAIFERLKILENIVDNEFYHKPLIFLCHTKEDRDAVKKLHNKLKEAGFNPWMDEINILPGQKWDLEINKAMKRTDFVLVCLSSISVKKRGYFNKEVKWAFDRQDEMLEGDIFVIPVKLEECELPEHLSDWQVVDLFEDDGFERLCKALGSQIELLGKKPPSSKSKIYVLTIKTVKYLKEKYLQILTLLFVIAVYYSYSYHIASDRFVTERAHLANNLKLFKDKMEEGRKANDIVGCRQSLSKIPSLQKDMLLPIEPKFFNYISIFKSLMSEKIKDDRAIDDLKNVIMEWKDHLDGIILREIELSGAYLQKANLMNTILVNANLSGTSLYQANLQGADLSGARLNIYIDKRTNLSKADLTKATLDGAVLKGADLFEAKLVNATLIGADLTGAILNNASLNEANLNGATLTGANLSGANLSGATFVEADISKVNLNKAIWSIEQLSSAKTLVDAHCEDDAICEKKLQDLRGKFPHIFK